MSLIGSIDEILHGLMDHDDPKVREAAGSAHRDIHVLAGLLSDEPEIRASMASELAARVNGDQKMATTYAANQTVTMPGGVYRVWMTTTKRVMEIERENPDTGNWRKVWQAAMSKAIGKRLMTVVTLAGAHH